MQSNTVIKILLMGHILEVISAFAVNSASVYIGLIFNQYKVKSMIWGNTSEKQ